jgi:phosphocarrier protein HPr
MKDELMPHSPVTASALLTNAVGLHARPSVKLTQLAKRFAAEVELALEADGPWVDAKSPVKIMRVKAPKGAILFFRAKGADADAAVASLAALVERRFDEEDEEPVAGASHG